MKECSIKGCQESISETFSDTSLFTNWIVLKACQCGAYLAVNMKACECTSESPIPTQYWPNLDWWLFGGVDEVVLCPRHKVAVFREIVRQRGLDPSMNPTDPDYSNRH